MPIVIEFKTAKFDPASEPPNRINPIRGHSILAWLRAHVIPEATEPAAEDWGWYSEVEFEGSNYLVGSICHDPDDGSTSPLRDWMIQIHKQRSIADRVLGRNKIEPGDPLAATIVTALRADPAFLEVHEHVD
jgi:hypothetical protein